MADKSLYIPAIDWTNFLKSLSREAELWGPKLSGSRVNISRVSADDVDSIIYDSIRPVQPLKSIFYPIKEKVSGTKNIKPTVIIGMKACDLAALPLMDKVFLSGDFVDPFYKASRDNITIISSDCTDPGKSCMCTLVNVQPFGRTGFDLNLTKIAGGFIVETGSEKGKKLIQRQSSLFSPADGNQISEREEIRKKTVKQVAEVNKEFNFKEPLDKIVRAHFGHPSWEKSAETCMSCTACTNVCPTCHCFLLAEADPETMEKMRLWDSCQYTGFARVAGGANPRAKLPERFKNRYYCKYYYRPEMFGYVGCLGCGRCIDACAGKIDKRKVIQELTK